MQILKSVVLLQILKFVKMSNVVSRRDGFISDIMKMIVNGSSNDVKIILQDGEIMANKDIISARCEYFATMFSNNEVKFIEGETNSVDMSFCRKVVMEKIIAFLYIGDVELHDLSLAHLMELMHMSDMMLLEDLVADTEKFMLGFLPDSGVNYGSIPELVEGLMLAEQFKLETIKDALLLELFLSLKDIPHIPEVVENCEAFKCLPVSLLKAILLHDDARERTVGDSKERLNAFVFWLSENECSEEDRWEITDSFNFEEFTADELLTDVRKSGLYSIEKIDTRLKELFDDQKKSLVDKDKRFRTLKSYYISEKREAENQEKIATQLKLALNNEKQKTEDLEKSIKEKDYEIEKREDQVEHLEFMVKSKETTMSSLEVRVSDRDAQITLLEFDIRDKSDRIEEYEEKIESMDSQINLLKDQAFEKDRTIDRMRMSNMTKDGEIQELYVENDQMRDRIDELESVRIRGRGRGRGNRNYSHR